MNVTIGIPAFNEEANLPHILEKLSKITDSIIVCDDGSNDRTSVIAKEFDVKLIKHEKNLGYGAAMRSIFEKALDIDTDVLVTFDADGQHRIEDIKKVLGPIEDGSSDIVIGSRFLNKNNEVPGYRKFGIKIITQVTNATIKENFTDSQSGFRAYRKQVLENIVLTEQGMGISTEILIKASEKKFRITETPIKIIYHGDTSTHNPVSHGTSVLISTIKFTSIQHPLKFYGIPALILIGIGVVFTYFSVDYYTEIGRLNTNLTLISAGTLLLGSILFISAILLYSLITVVRESKN
ncbi:MAG: glycosyl transferase [Dehalococcoidaceae bacterium]|nr:glycosyl transferase [Dehalococcoidaceae bacterium]|tara:strand:+ start:832 stop:1713 length:882 start_codon:yes stop_codon:yes gene_type:complete